MNSEDRIISNHRNRKKRKRRVAFIKAAIVIVILSLLVIPTICSFLLFARVNRIQKQMDALLELHEYEYTEQSLQEETPKFVVHAAEAGMRQMTGADENIVKAANPEGSDAQADPAIAGSKAAALDQDTAGLAEKERIQREKKEKNVKYADELIEGPRAYLTFDDGPSKYTEEILDILSKYHVKATFFVIGKTDKASKESYRRIVDEGHTLAMHSYTHRYKEIYHSLESFQEDFDRISALLYDTTGVKTKFYRFPGGSSNRVSKVDMGKLISYFNKEGIVYFDWNVVNGDATGEKLGVKEMVENVRSGVKGMHSSVILMHDTEAKKVTVEALPEIIEQLKNQGITLLPITEETKPVQHILADSVK